MYRETILLKPATKLSSLWASPEAWLFAASILWCAVLGSSLVYALLIAVL